MSTPAHILWLDRCGTGDADLIGGKGLGLARLIDASLPVPAGFVVSTATYLDAVRDAGLIGPLAETPADDDPASAADLSRRLRSLFVPSVLDEALRKEIAAAYDALCDGSEGPVAVRSSATAEDLAGASFAGQQDTFLWVEGAEAVAGKVLDCWASLFSPAAIGYRHRFEVSAANLAMAVVVQRMVPAAAAGVMMTLDPASGDRSRIYIESAYGLGESVVRGEVDPDRIWIDKALLDIARREIGEKATAYQFGPGGVTVDKVNEEERLRCSLRDDEIVALARLGAEIEERFGAAMDIEWAVAEGDSPNRTLHLLQARPETVWSRRAQTDLHSDQDAAAPVDIDPAEDWDPLHSPSVAGLHWTTDNVGEAMPGVLTPLTWSLWGPLGEEAVRTSFWTIGGMSAAERAMPSRVEDRVVRIFYGRVAMQVELLAMLGDRLPGTSGQEIVRGIFGQVPEDIVYRNTMRRYPVIAWKLPKAFVSLPGRIRRLSADSDAWWTEELVRIPQLDLAATIEAFRLASARFHQAVTLQTVGLLSVVQPLYEALTKLVESTGVGDVSVLSGSGGAELAVVSDLWQASRHEIALATVLERHGFHGPREGELSSRVWREDPSPLERLLGDYAARPDNDDPRRRAEGGVSAMTAMQAEVLAAVSRSRRPAVRMLLNLAASRVPLRGVAKRSFLQGLDVARCAARHAGGLLAEAGQLEDPDDIFFLTTDELATTLPADAADLIVRRRARRAYYETLTLPGSWTGMPVPLSAPAPGSPADGSVTGIGVSPGVVEGVCRVLMDPAEPVTPDEILIAPTTDPSWSSVMFISAGLVVDIGGALSHAAVVARELGIPCVVNTRTGTRMLRTGDRIRVDGSTGLVEVLSRAGEVA